MKLYHYLPKENNARKVGILTLSKKPEEIKKYEKLSPIKKIKGYKSIKILLDKWFYFLYNSAQIL